MAVQEMQGIEQVYVARPDNCVYVVNVTLGPQAGEDWIITSGYESWTLPFSVLLSTSVAILGAYLALLRASRSPRRRRRGCISGR